MFPFLCIKKPENKNLKDVNRMGKKKKKKKR